MMDYGRHCVNLIIKAYPRFIIKWRHLHSDTVVAINFLPLWALFKVNGSKSMLD